MRKTFSSGNDDRPEQRSRRCATGKTPIKSRGGFFMRKTGARSVDWGVVTAKQLQGKTLFQQLPRSGSPPGILVSEFRQTAVASSSTTRPAAWRSRPAARRYRAALACDPQAPLAALSRSIKKWSATAEEMNQDFCRMRHLPRATVSRRWRSSRKGENLRVLTCLRRSSDAAREFDVKRVSAGSSFRKRLCPPEKT